MNRDERQAQVYEEMLGVVDRVSGNLRHIYKQLAAGQVIDQKQMAEGLLGPQIQYLEKLSNVLQMGIDGFRKLAAETEKLK